METKRKIIFADVQKTSQEPKDYSLPHYSPPYVKGWIEFALNQKNLGNIIVPCTGLSPADFQHEVSNPELGYGALNVEESLAVFDNGSTIGSVGGEQTEVKEFTMQEIESILTAIMTFKDDIENIWLHNQTFSQTLFGSEEHLIERLEEILYIQRLPNIFLTIKNITLENFADLMIRMLSVIICSDQHIFLQPSDIHKGSGIREVSQKLGIDLKDCIVLGDSEVDLPMWQEQGIGKKFKVGKAKLHPWMIKRFGSPKNLIEIPHHSLVVQTLIN